VPQALERLHPNNSAVCAGLISLLAASTDFGTREVKPKSSVIFDGRNLYDSALVRGAGL